MKNATKKILSAATFMAAAALTGCSTPISVKFDVTKPWEGPGEYEQLMYTAVVYDCTNGSKTDERVQIGEGNLTYTLDMRSRVSGATIYNTLDMSFYVTYNDAAPELDRGKTDRITSVTEFQNASLVTSKMQKSVIISDRDGKDNLSYDVAADYFDEHKATRLMTFKQGAEEETMSIPSETYYDNETMFYLARATGFSLSASTTFYMTNIFDSFVNGKFTQYQMTATPANAMQNVDLGQWTTAFGVEEVSGDDGVSYPISCFNVAIAINANNRGPAYNVYYTEKPFVSGDESHAKIPVKIQYPQYENNKLTRMTEYTLNNCSFVKPE